MQTILVIEDDPVIREELAFLLNNEGYQAWPVTDFEIIPEQIHAVRPDLVLLNFCPTGWPARGKSSRGLI